MRAVYLLALGLVTSLTSASEAQQDGAKKDKAALKKY